MKNSTQENVLNKSVQSYNESIDIVCAICQEILCEPVALPCSHHFCKLCLETSIRTLSQRCPCCRQRFTSWYRHAIKNNQLIDQNLWQQIQRDNGDLLKIGGKIQKNHKGTPLRDIQNQIILSQTGEIGREFKELHEKLSEEQRQKELDEEIASQKAIFELFKDELLFKKPQLSTSHKRTTNKENSDNMLVAGPSHAYQTCIGGNRTAGTLIGGRGSISKSNTSVITISSTSSPSCSSSMSNSYGLFKTVVEVVSRGKEIIKQKVSEKIFPNSSRKDNKSFSNSPSLVLPTHTHKRSSSRASSVDSNDSLKSEIRHFKPIRTAPTTPKKLNGDILRIPSVRPDSAGSIEILFSPSASSLSPINPNLPRRRSAFSVVAATKIVPVTSTPKEPVILKRGRKRKSTLAQTVVREENVIPKKIKKAEPIASTSKDTRQNGRMTRGRSLNKLNGIRDPIFNMNSLVDNEKIQNDIIKEQLKLQEIIEQEKRDFEFAKKLQNKLNKVEREVRPEYSLRSTRTSTRRMNGQALEKENNKSKQSKIKENSPQKKENGKPLRKTKSQIEATKSPVIVTARRSLRKRN